MMLTTYIPRLEDLWFKKAMLADEATMAFNHAYGGTIDFHEDLWESWHKRWISESKNRYYAYLVNESGDFVGEIAYRYEEDSSRYICDLLVFAPFRGHGYGRMGLSILLDIARQNGIKILYDEIAIDNPSIHLFLKFGFKEVERTENAITIYKELG